LIPYVVIDFVERLSGAPVRLIDSRRGFVLDEADDEYDESDNEEDAEKQVFC
jgi:hypothetical protein